MELFNKEKNEQMAINYLKRYDNKYRGLVKFECSDFISEENSIGVEVTLVEFEEFIESFIYKDKSLKEYILMKGIKPKKKKEFSDINKAMYGKHSSKIDNIFNRFIDSFYYKKGGNILKLQSIEQYKKLDPNTNLYLKSSFPDSLFISNQKISAYLPSCVWIGQIVDKYIEAVKAKNRKLINYKKFNENTLILINYTAGLEESLEFEKKVNEIENLNFDKIFIFNALFGISMHEIDLKKV